MAVSVWHSSKETEAARDVNDIIRLDPADQGPLLDVLESYFLTDSSPPEELDSDSEPDSDLETGKQAPGTPTRIPLHCMKMHNIRM